MKTPIFLKQYPVAAAYLFGSQATGKSGPLSDYDIAILLNEDTPTEDFFDLKLKLIGEFSEKLRTDTIDLVILNTAPLLLRMSVVKEGEMIYCKDKPYRVAFETYTMNSYYDRLPYLERHSEYVLNRLAQ